MENLVTTWQEFQQRWNGVTNFLMGGECVPFSFTMPSLEEVIEETRRDPDVGIGHGTKGAAFHVTDNRDAFRALPIADAVESPFQLTHYKLSNFYGKGQLFEGFFEQVMEPWQAALRAHGFSWTRCYPILFVSGPGCATNYHLDYSHVLAWQIHGTKIFSGLHDPDRWAPLEKRIHHGGRPHPAEITEADTLAYEMPPGSVLWNCFLTPHWVEATDRTSYSINISHGGLALNGQLAPHEAELAAWRDEHPEDARLGLIRDPNAV